MYSPLSTSIILQYSTMNRFYSPLSSICILTYVNHYKPSISHCWSWLATIHGCVFSVRQMWIVTWTCGSLAVDIHSLRGAAGVRGVHFLGTQGILKPKIVLKIHGSLNVPIEHHPTIRYMVNAMATIRWCPIFPKWDIYQPLKLYLHLKMYIWMYLGVP